MKRLNSFKRDFNRLLSVLCLWAQFAFPVFLPESKKIISEIKSSKLIHENQVVRKAISILDTMYQNNDHDFVLLKKWLEPFDWNSSKISHVRAELLRLQNDWEFESNKLKSSEDVCLLEFNDEIVKFIHRNEFVKAADLLERHGKGVLDLIVDNGDIVTKKIILIAVLKYGVNDVDFTNKLKLLKGTYPYDITYDRPLLFAGQFGVVLPHAGYIQRGLIENGGTDCSGFVGHSIGWDEEEKMSTHLLERIGQYLETQHSQKPIDVDPVIKNYAKRFQLVHDDKKLQPGDFINWRWKSENKDFYESDYGHVVLFIKYSDEPGMFYSLEVARFADRLDGGGSRHLSLERTEKDGFKNIRRHILRPILN